MITCQTCGKMTGSGEVGDHWICQDCKLDRTEQESAQQREEQQPKQ